MQSGFLSIVLQQSVVMVASLLHNQFAWRPLYSNQLSRDHFVAVSCLAASFCIPKPPGQPSASAETVKQVHEAFLRSPWKSVRRASMETHIPQKFGKF